MRLEISKGLTNWWFEKKKSLQETCYAKSRPPTLSCSYCNGIKGVEPAYIRVELGSTQQLSGIQIPSNQWSYTKDQSDHIA